jgi:dTDP-4-dehydrorhamnose reductase
LEEAKLYLKMQTVLITGGNGFVGSCLARILLGHCKIIVTGKGYTRLDIQHPHFQYVQLNFTDEGEVKKVLGHFQPQVIVHAGAMSKPDECEQDKQLAYLTNVSATQFLLREAVAFKSFFIFLSTDFIFDGLKGMYQEDDNPGPVNYYGETKLLAEASVQKYPFDWSIVRTVLVYGHPRGGRQNILNTVAAALKKGDSYSVFNDQVRTPTYVEDLAGALKTIIDKKATGIFHISGKDVLTPYVMAIAAANYLGLDENLVKKVTAETFDQPAQRPAITGFNISKAERELNYKPTSFEEGLKKTFD